MPLTPRFELSQTPSEVIVTIFVPTVRVSNIEVVLEEDSTFHFHASPYLLKLHFAPHEFAEDGNIPAAYDPSCQTVSVPLKKAHPGVEWPNLQLTARLLQPKEIPKQWLNEVQNGHEEDISGDDRGDNYDVPEGSVLQLNSFGYGFGGMFQNIFTDYCRGGLAQEMLQLPEPETTTPDERRRLRIQKEENDFDEERYHQDLYIEEDYLYPMVMDFHPFWIKKDGKQSKDSLTGADDVLATQFQELRLDSDANAFFSSDDRLSLSTIPYPLIPARLLDIKGETSHFWAGLLDLLVPFVYDHLTTTGDPTVESAWTITTLSASLSWLDPPTDIQDAVRVSTRRMLVYPYWRNFDFCQHVWRQTFALLEAGVYAVVKALLMTRTILEKSESYYLGCKLFVDPYLYWIQQHDGSELPKGVIAALANQLKDPDRLKREASLHLVELETKLNDDLGSESGESDSSDDSSTSSSGSDRVASNDQDGKGDQPNHAGAEGRKVPELLDAVVGHGVSILTITGNSDTDEGLEKPSSEQNGTNAKKQSPLVQEWNP